MGLTLSSCTPCQDLDDVQGDAARGPEQDTPPTLPQPSADLQLPKPTNPRMAFDLASVKLRATAPPPTRTAVTANAVERERYLNQRLRDCDLEAWYDALKDFTFPAIFLPISQEEGRAIITRFTRHKNGKAALQSLRTNTSPKDILVDLTRRINDAGAQLPSRRRTSPESFPSVFVKLSCRSPKDSGGRQFKAHELAASKLRDWCKLHPGQAPDGNTLGAAIYFGTINCLRLESAAEVLECLVTSERVCEDDLPLALSFPDKWSQHIVLRPWVPIPTEHEFRAFVFGGRLTGLCQYFSSVYFPALLARKNDIEKMVVDFFASVKDRIPMEPAEYVMDLAVDIESGKVFIIEFNPFGAPDGMGTGTVMFNLDHDHDKDVLFGEAPFEFRITERPVAGVDSLIKGEWRTFLQDEGFL